MTPQAVIFDWRGTLAMTLTDRHWAAAALQRAGRDATPRAVRAVVDRLHAAPSLHRLQDSDLDADAALHRRAFGAVLAEAGFDDTLAQALYAAESDPALNPFAGDAQPCLARLRERGARVAVLSDIHVDIRPAFARAGLAEHVDAFVLSFEHGLHKPDLRIFSIALHRLGTAAEDTLMVGDRSACDGAAVEAGMPSLLLPPLRSVHDQRLHLVEALVAAPD